MLQDLSQIAGAPKSPGNFPEAKLPPPFPSYALRDAQDQNSWICLSHAAFLGYSPAAGAALVHEIIAAGGRVAICDYQSESHVTKKHLPELYARTVLPQLKQLISDYDESHLRMVTIPGSYSQEFFFLRDLIGVFSRTGQDSYCYHRPSFTFKHEGRENIVLGVPFSEYSSLEVTTSPRWLGGEVVFLGDDAVLVTEGYKGLRNHTRGEIADRFASAFGRKRLLITSAADVGDESVQHADYVAAHVENAVCIPEVLDASIALLDRPQRVEGIALQSRMNHVAEVVSAEGFTLRRMPMPLAKFPADIDLLMSPANLLQVRHRESGKVTALVPWVMNANLEHYPDAKSHAVLKNRCAAALREAGAAAVRFIPCDARYHGLLHCMTQYLPDPIVEKLPLREF